MTPCAPFEHFSELHSFRTKHRSLLVTGTGTGTGHGSNAGRVGLAATIFDDFALEQPDFDANRPERRLCSRCCVVDISTKRVKWHATLVVTFDTRDFSTAESSTAFDLDPAGSHAHCTL